MLRKRDPVAEAEKQLLDKMFPMGGSQKQQLEQQFKADNEQRKKEQRSKSFKSVWFAFLVLFGASVGFILLSLLWKGITGLFSIP